MKVKRFFYVSAPGSKIVHMLFGKRVEGERLACGRRTSWPGWKWFTLRGWSPVCKDCGAAVGKMRGTIVVQRVRG